MPLEFAVRRSTRLYARLLRIYPSSFVADFGQEMVDVFETSLNERVAQHGWSGLIAAWFCVMRELVPTLLRERADAWSTEWREGDLQPRLRVAAAGALPACGLMAMLNFSPRWEETALVSVWLACVTGGVIIARGRGTRCLVNAMTGGAAALAGTIGFCVLFVPQATPPPFTVALLLLLAAATAGLILASAMRLLIEGISLRRPMASA